MYIIAERAADLIKAAHGLSSGADSTSQSQSSSAHINSLPLSMIFLVTVATLIQLV